MLFIPFKDIDDLMLNGSYWKMYWREINAAAANGSTQKFWPKGKEILQNIQDRKTTEQKM
jgi:hypothetical protein